MAPFDPDADLSHDRAFLLARNSAVSLFPRAGILDETAAWLDDHGYRLVRLDAGAWATQADFHRDVKAALGFPDHYGENLDAFNDCLRDVALHVPDATGTVLVFTGYDAFARREPRAAPVILDIIAVQSRAAMLFGHRMLCLVETADPEIAFPPVGATPVVWNPWSRAVRR